MAGKKRFLLIGILFGVLSAMLALGGCSHSQNADTGSEAAGQEEVVYTELASFPEGAIREAVSGRVDADADGKLSPEEAQKVIGLYVQDGKAVVILEGEDLPEPSLQPVAAEPKEEGESSEGASADDGEWVSVFPALKTLVVPDCKLAALDLSHNEALEFADCRANALSSINLASCKNLKALFCDSGVPLEGLDEAGLYYEDLLTEAKNFGEKGTLTVTYDASGRPIEAKQEGMDEAPRLLTYSYDEHGRLSAYSGAHVDSDLGEGKYEFTYSYNDRGLLDRLTPNNDYSRSLYESTYRYDENGLLREGQTDDVNSDGELDTTSSVVLQVKQNTVTIEESVHRYGAVHSLTEDTCKLNDNGCVYLCESEGDFGSSRTTYSYNDSGQLIGVESRDTGDDSLDDYGLSVSGDSQSARFAMSISGVESEWQYVCNQDGYVESVTCDQSSWGEGSVKLGIAYMKMVSNLSDRMERRYVPEFFPGIVPSGDTPGGTLGSLENWVFSNGAGVREYRPEQAVFNAMGLTPRFLASANEVKLLAYDREHWQDGLGTSSESSETVETDADSSQIKVQTSAYSFTLPKDWSDKVDVSTEDAEDGYPSTTVTLKGNPDALVFNLSVVDDSEEMLDGDPSGCILARKNISGGKRLELASRLYPQYLIETGGDDEYSSWTISEDEYEDLFELTLGKRYAFDEVMANASQDNIEQFYDTQVSWLTDQVMDQIV